MRVLLWVGIWWGTLAIWTLSDTPNAGLASGVGVATGYALRVAWEKPDKPAP